MKLWRWGWHNIKHENLTSNQDEGMPATLTFSYSLKYKWDRNIEGGCISNPENVHILPPVEQVGNFFRNHFFFPTFLFKFSPEVCKLCILTFSVRTASAGRDSLILIFPNLLPPLFLSEQVDEHLNSIQLTEH